VASALQRPFLGRREILTAFRERRERVLQGHGAVSVLEGDAGVGKSTFLDSFLEECRRRGDRVLRARGRPGAEPPPFQLLREALLARGGALLAATVAEAASSEGGAEERLAQLLRTLGDGGEPSRTRHLAPLADTLFGLARSAPTILALEDVDSADRSSLDFLAYLAPFLPAHRLWLILVTLPVGGLHDRARRLLEELPRDADVDRWALRPLAPGEIAEFARWVDPFRPVRASELTRWFTQTGGNPLFLEQLLRSAHRHTPSIWEDANAAGVPLTEFVRARVAELPEEERRVLSLGAVIGREIPFPTLLAAANLEEEPLAEIVERLVERGLLRESSADELEFAREDLRELVYAGLTEPLRRLLHQRVALTMESLGRSDPDAIFAIAHHSYLGKVDPMAIEYNRRAAEFAARLLSPEIARTHLERTLECLRRERPDDRATELELVLELALVLDRAGELERAEATLREALARGPPDPAHSGGAVPLLPIYLARILTDEGRWDEARRLTDRLLDHLDDLRAPEARLALLRLRGEIEYYRGEYAEAIRYHDRALEIARAEGDLREVALTTVRRANALAMNPDTVAEAIPAYREASEELLRLGDRSEAAYALLFLGVTLAQRERTAEGLAELESAAELAEQASDLRELGWALFNVADLRRELGELAEAHRQNARSREILHRIGDRFGLAQTYIIAGKIALAEKDLPAAERELLEAFRQVRELRTEPDELEVLLRLAEVALGRGELPLARQRAEELDRREIGRLRPDLVADTRRLTERLRAAEEGVDAPVSA
jgi:tetratricopeptide (TPR) repeat protein